MEEKNDYGGCYMPMPSPLSQGRGMTDNFFCDAAHEKSFQAGSAVGSHNYGICLLLICHIHDRLPGLSFSDKSFCFDPCGFCYLLRLVHIGLSLDNEIVPGLRRLAVELGRHIHQRKNDKLSTIRLCKVNSFFRELLQ